MPNDTPFSVFIDETPYEIFGPIVAAGKLLRVAGREPPDDWRLVAIRREGCEALRPAEEVDLRSPGNVRFITYRGDRIFVFTLDSVEHEWPSPDLSETELMSLAVAQPCGRIRLHRDGEADRLLDRAERVSLAAAGTERFSSVSEIQEAFIIIVNGTQKTVHMSILTFAAIVSLAFPGPPLGPNVMFTVAYRKGPGNPPDGSLVEGGTVKIQKGMVFDVTSTDKS